MTAAYRDQTQRGWNVKFRDAFRGLWRGVRGQNSFRVHGAFAVAVVIMAAVLRIGLVQWCILLLCITTVVVAELFNTALEWMAKAIDRHENARIGGALDIASAAVLFSAFGAAIVGATVFLHRVAVLLSWCAE